MADPPRPAVHPVSGVDATMIATDASLGEARLGASATLFDPRTRDKERADAGPEAAAGRRRGDVLGRYVVLGELGQGGMGVVLAAYDPELERKVAIKLLRSGGAGETSGRAWLAREAQAMAQLSHPNVVAIHDVGAVDGQLYIAMEHVEGETLAAWLAAGPRPWREILAVFLQAGEGLQAAHAAGLVHRDFKPDNVMLSADGRVRVMDFGLARPERAPLAPRPPPTRDGASALDSVLTRAGAIMGTPRYMAPEQWAGDEADARSDLFSFCVALWEALHGAHPFRGETLADLAIAVTGGAIEPPPPRSRVPARLRRALARGLAALPVRRWPSMRALLDELGRDRTPQRRRLTAAAAVGLALVVGLVGWRVDHRARVDACAREAAAIGAVWNADASARVRDALTATGLPFAASSADAITVTLDRFTRAWSAARAGACEGATVDGTIEPALHGRMERCLDEARDEVTALIDSALGGDRGVALRLPGAAASLRPPELCTDPQWLAPYEPIAAPLAVPAGAVARDLARVNGLIAAGDLDGAAALAGRTHALAEALGVELLIARADLAIGAVAQRRGDALQARDALEAAFYRAGSINADKVAADAAARLAFVVGYRLSDRKAGAAWIRLAEMELARTDAGEDDYLRAVLHNAAGVIAFAANESPEGEAHFRETVRIAERVFGPDHPIIGAALGNIGTILWTRGDYEGALAIHERSYATRLRALGPDHPDVARDLDNLGATLVGLGRLDEALDRHQRALAIREAALGPTSSEVGESLDNLCSLHFSLGHLDAAEPLCERAITVRDAGFGVDSPHAAYARATLVALRRSRGATDLAAEIDRVIKILEASFGAESLDLAGPLNVRAFLALDRQDPEAALVDGERSRRLTAETPSRPESIVALGVIGEAELALGRPLDAAASFEVALAAAESRTHFDPLDAADLRFGLARALDASGREPERARALAREAEAALAARLSSPLTLLLARRLLAVHAWRVARPEP